MSKKESWAAKDFRTQTEHFRATGEMLDMYPEYQDQKKDSWSIFPKYKVIRENEDGGQLIASYGVLRFKIAIIVLALMYLFWAAHGGPKFVVGEIQDGPLFKPGLAVGPSMAITLIIATALTFLGDALAVLVFMFSWVKYLLYPFLWIGIVIVVLGTLEAAAKMLGLK